MGGAEIVVHRANMKAVFYSCICKTQYLLCTDNKNSLQLMPKKLK